MSFDLKMNEKERNVILLLKEDGRMDVELGSSFFCSCQGPFAFAKY